MEFHSNKRNDASWKKAKCVEVLKECYLKAMAFPFWTLFIKHDIFEETNATESMGVRLMLAIALN